MGGESHTPETISLIMGEERKAGRGEVGSGLGSAWTSYVTWGWLFVSLSGLETSYL